MYKISMKMGSGSLRAKGKKIVAVPTGVGIVLSDSDYKAFKPSIEALGALVDVTKTNADAIETPSVAKAEKKEAKKEEAPVEEKAVDKDEEKVEEKIEEAPAKEEKATKKKGSKKK